MFTRKHIGCIAIVATMAAYPAKAVKLEMKVHKPVQADLMVGTSSVDAYTPPKVSLRLTSRSRLNTIVLGGGQYTVLKKLGQGTEGSVFLLQETGSGTGEHGGRKFAMKFHETSGGRFD
jgi:hypothetical protein